MKLLFTADWQASLRNLDQCEAVLNQICELVTEKKVRAVIHLGDVKESFNPVDVRVTNWLVNATERIVKLCPFLVLLGNHDRSGPTDTAESCFPPMMAAGATVFDKPHIHGIESVFLRMVPFIRNTAKQREAFRQVRPVSLDKKHVNILCFHCDIRGAYYNAVKRCDTAGAISLEDVGDVYAGCFGGHIHFQQRHGQVQYVGSPFCQDWGEANQPKGFLLMDVKGRTVTVTPVPSCVPGWYDPDLPRHSWPKDWTGSRVRIHVPSSKNLEQALAKAKLAAQRDYPGAVHYYVMTHAPEEAVEFKADLTASDTDLLRQYLIRVPELKGRRGQAEAYLLSRLGAGGGLGIPELRFQKVLARNALCFEDAEIDLTVPGLTLVTGTNKDWADKSNGAGKSSLLSLPVVALFGMTPKGQGSDGWRRQGYEGTAGVGLSLLLPDGKKLEVYRQRSPVRLDLMVDDRDLTMGDVRGTQRLIEQITGLTWDVVVNSLYMGQGEVATILTGTDKMRKELFSRFLGLERYLKAHERVREDLRRCDNDLENGVGAEIRQIRALLEREQMALSQAGTPEEVSQEQLDRVRKTISSVQKRQQDFQSALVEQEKSLSNLRQQRQTAVTKSTLARSDVQRIEKQQERLGGMKGRCPFCGSKVTAKTLKAQREMLSAELATYRKDLDLWGKECVVVDKRLAEVADVLLQSRSSFQSSQDALVDHQRSLAQLEIRRETYLKEKQKQTEIASRIRELETALGYQKAYQEWLLKEQEFLRACLKVVGRDGLPAFLCASVCPTLNAAAAEFSGLFSDGAIRVRFALVEGEIDVQIQNDQGGEGVKDQSQGEMRMAALVTAFAFRQALVRANLLILDEPGEGLDAGNAAVFARGMAQVAQRFGSVFLTTHNANIVAELEPDRHLEVVKQDRIATVRAIL